MKIANAKDALQAIEEYEKAVRDLEWAEKATYFSVGCGPDKSSAEALISVQDVTPAMSSYSGQLAGELRNALIKYRKGHVDLAKDRLSKLGVEP
jgi:hypothetical protein